MSIIKKLSTVLLVASLFFVPCISQAATTNMTLSKTQYETLLQIIDKQDKTLTQLDLNLEVLQNTSTMQKKELIAANKDLEKSKEELKITKEKLSRAELSLEQADKMLQKNEKSLKKLNEEIKSLKRHQRIKDIKNVCRGIFFGFAFHYFLSK